MAEWESFERVQEQTFFRSFVEDEHRFKEFWPFYLNSEVADLESMSGRGSLNGYTKEEEDFEGVSIDLNFKIRAFSGSDPTLTGMF